MRSNALISVFDKTNLKEICSVLKKYDIGIISTGSTSKTIKKLGFSCKEVSKLTKFKEILDGRVKTLHPKIHASLLFNRNKLEHQKTFQELNVPIIDFIIVNLYPFSKIKENSDSRKKIEMIDIGGASIIRSGSKNYEFVTTISSKKYYKSFIKELSKNKGKTTLDYRKKMARENFKLTSQYDLEIHKWFLKKENKSKKINRFKIKYGENPNQKAFFISNSKFNIINNKISGKEIGYNNIVDISDGLSCLKEFDSPTCVIIKHNNPCGVASSNNISKAFVKACQSDPISSFGGVVLLNKKIGKELATIINKNFYEVVVAPSFDAEALNILMSKKNLIILNSKNLKEFKGLSFKTVNSGTLYQDTNSIKISRYQIKSVSDKKTNKKNIEDLIFAMKVAKHVKSNSIVLVKNKQTLGIGAGQMSRLDATKIALMKLNNYFKNKKFICASDAFFPFTDSIKILNKNGCQAIIQPSGSINDNKIIDYSKKNRLPLYFINNRFFKH